MRLPGFRKGKVPPQMVIQRLGREAVLEQALRDSLPSGTSAPFETALPTVGDPKLDVEDMPDEGEDLSFSFEVGVRPVATLGEYRGLEVGRADTDVPDESVDDELERLREGFGSLNPVERPAAEGDVVVIDYRGTIDDEIFEGSEGRTSRSRWAARVCSRSSTRPSAAPRPATTSRSRSPSPTTISRRSSPARPLNFALTVKEVREKELPELDDDFAQQASEFDTLEELREEIRERHPRGARAARRRRVPRGRGRRRRRPRHGRPSRRARPCPGA